MQEHFLLLSVIALLLHFLLVVHLFFLHLPVCAYHFACSVVCLILAPLCISFCAMEGNPTHILFAFYFYKTEKKNFFEKVVLVLLPSLRS